MQVLPKTATPSPPATETFTLDIQGMKCASCVKAVEKQLVQYPGVISACVNLVTEVAVVESEATVDPVALAAKVTAAGFPTQARTIDKTTTDQHREINSRWQLVTAGVLLLLSSLGHLTQWSGLSLPLALHNIWFHCGLATTALLIPGRQIIVDGWRGLRRRSPNMNTLVGLGTLTAYTASLIALLFPQLGWECFFDEPVMLLGFILLGRTLEQQARNQAASSFRQLLLLQPQVARLIAQPQQTALEINSSTPSIEIPAEQVRVGEWLQVLPGEKIPVDGEVVAGKTTVDESMLTGESIPVLKQPQDQVAAGTLNQSGVIAIRATRTGKDTTVAHIVSLVEAAQTQKAPVQRLADTVAGYFTYGVLTAAALTFVFWYFIGIHIWPEVLHVLDWSSTQNLNLHTQHLAHATAKIQPSPLLLSLKLSIAVMVVACPCALGLATPTAILVGTSIGAERGLLIKGGDVLERVHYLNTVVFDKTGTLTTGHATITDCLTFTDITSTQLLQIAAAAESGTLHPLATAIGQASQQQGLPLLPATEFHTEPGLGISAKVNGKRVLIGNWEWLTQNSIPFNPTAQYQGAALAAEGKTVVYIAIDSVLAGLIAVRDTVRADAAAAVAQLRQMGLRVMLLTGDKPEAARVVAAAVGINSSDLLADVPPAAKASAIQQLQAQPGCQVAMVGDGINDAPALSQADVGVALHAGTDVAMETAQIVLMGNRLSDVVTAIALSRATFNKIRQNLFWAFAYNLMGIPVAAGILLPSYGFVLSPGEAGALMAFSSVSVVTNSLLLRRQFSPLRNEMISVDQG